MLVVEGNLLNQEIVRSMLENWGLQVSLVASGTEALSFLQTQRPNLIEMDIQLPGMDGVETTQHIRCLPQGADLPIIALTANALPGDRETYLAAGMNNYLAKPINPHQLHALTKQWLQPEVQTSDRLEDDFFDMSEDPDGDEPDFSALVQQGLNTEEALARLMNNAALYRQLLKTFAIERCDFPAELVQLADTNDREGLLLKVHSLTSVSGSLGMTQLYLKSKSCEQTLRSGQTNSEQLDELAREIRQVVTLINAWLAAG